MIEHTTVVECNRFEPHAPRSRLREGRNPRLDAGRARNVVRDVMGGFGPSRFRFSSILPSILPQEDAARGRLRAHARYGASLARVCVAPVVKCAEPLYGVG